MPIYEYTCPKGHRTVKLFPTFREAAPFIDDAPCEHCAEHAARTPSVPFDAHLYGDPAGYYKPSPTKRFSTKLINSYGNN